MHYALSLRHQNVWGNRLEQLTAPHLGLGSFLAIHQFLPSSFLLLSSPPHTVPASLPPLNKLLNANVAFGGCKHSSYVSQLRDVCVYVCVSVCRWGWGKGVEGKRGRERGDKQWDCVRQETSFNGNENENGNGNGQRHRRRPSPCPPPPSAPLSLPLPGQRQHWLK